MSSFLIALKGSLIKSFDKPDINGKLLIQRLKHHKCLRGIIKPTEYHCKFYG